MKEKNILYKFLPTEYMINVLENLEFKCTSPEEYSDIHDSAFILDEDLDYTLNVPGQMQYIIERDFDEIPLSEDWKAEFNKWKEESESLFKNHKLHSIKLMERFPNKESIKNFKKGFFETLDRKKLTFCMTKSATNRLMWDIYASGHKGIAVGINIEHGIFNTPINFPMEMDYLDKIETLPLSVAIWRKWLLKNKEYEFEKEVRSVFFERQLIKRKIQNTDMHFLKLPLDALECIILGANISKENELRIINLYEGQVEILKCKASKSNYDLIVE
ncbi:hypothetical protein [Serratia plymuthica]|uniref:hypothetical protein n=1 Tax=Serratia plymuthica TaxID=82996 RepID=UPI00045646D5|nr:hypothetical protein [Serratia plymuthica]AHY09911.1 hypothetical protein sch_10595 [Serratia plymuthica]